MKSKFLMAAAVAAALPATASAGFISNADFQAHARETLVKAEESQVNDPRFFAGLTQYTGVGGLIINTDSGDADGGVGLCTGALISPTIVLTAAHCLDGGDENRVRFRTGASTFQSVPQYEALGTLIHPSYGGLGDDDIAFVLLSAPASNGEEIYDIYRDRDEIYRESNGDGAAELAAKTHTKVGNGSTGYGDIGTDRRTFDDDGNPSTPEVPLNPSDFAKRFGENVYEAQGDEIFFGVNDNVLLFDFDSGLQENDVFGRIADDFNFTQRQTGITDPVTGELLESNSSPGDSGGPTFINGLIAGVTSFGITGAIFDPPGEPLLDENGDPVLDDNGNPVIVAACGPGRLDPDGPANPDLDIELQDPTLGSCTNSSFGELSGDTRVSGYAAFIDGLLAGQFAFNLFVPAPGAIGLLGLGVGGLMVARRRRKVA